MSRSALSASRSLFDPRLVDERWTSGRSPRRLLLAVDRSAASRAALLAVAGLATGGRTGVVVLHVDDRREPDEGRKLAGAAAGALIALAVDARPEVRQARRGHVPEVIAAAAAEHGSDLVVLGSRGRSDLGGLLPGGIGRQVLERVRCPVLLVRAGRRAGSRRQRVLVAVAGDEDQSELVATAAAVADHDARVLVLHLLAPGQDGLQSALSEHLVEQMVLGLRRCGVHARGRVRAGSHGAADEIARTALAFGADLVVVGSRRLPALAALVDGSVSPGVVRRAGGPLPGGAPGDGEPEE